VAGVHLVGDGQAFCGLYQRQHELPLHMPGLALAEGAHVVGHDRLAAHRHRGQVIEDHGQLLVNQRTHQRGQPGAECGAVFVKHVHRAQQMLMLRQPIGEAEVHGQRHRVEPAQHTELAARVAQTVEHHRAQTGQHIDVHARAAPGGGQVIEAERAPQLPQRPDVAGAAAVDEAQAVQDGALSLDLQPTSALQRANQCIDLATGFKSTEGAHGALTRLTIIVAERLHQLSVAPRTGLGDLDEHRLECSPGSAQ